MSQLIFRLADKIYHHIFGYPMGERAQKFVENLIFIAAGLTTSSLLVFGCFVVAGRLLGPEEYGKANLVFAISNFLVIPMGFGLHLAVTKYLSQEGEKTKIFSSGFYLFVITTTISLLFFYNFRHSIISIFHIPNDIFLLALLYCVILAPNIFLQAALRGLQDFKKISFLTILSGLIFAVVIFVFFFIFHKKNFNILVFSYILRFVPIILIILILLRQYFGHFEVRWGKKLFKYGAIAVFGMTPAFFMENVDKFMLYSLFSIESVGVYAAYILASNMIIIKGLEIFLVVFFPTLSASEDKCLIFLKLQRLLKFVSIPIFMGSALAIIVTLFFFGEKYPISLGFVMLFALSSTLLIVMTIYNWFIASISARALMYMALNIWLAAILNILINFIFIPVWGVAGASMATILSLIYLISISYVYLKRVKKFTNISASYFKRANS